MNRPWLESLELRPDIAAEIDVEPDGTVEVSWVRTTAGDAHSLTLLLRPDIFRGIVDRGKELDMLGKIARSNDGPSR